MIGVDTNILLRFLTRDDEAQAQKAAQILTHYCSDARPAYITTIVLVELVWTLRRCYGYKKEQIVTVLDLLLNAQEIRLEHPDEAHFALHDYSSSNADFSDALLGFIAARQGCTTTLTFDVKAARLAMFDHVDDMF